MTITADEFFGKDFKVYDTLVFDRGLSYFHDMMGRQLENYIRLEDA